MVVANRFLEFALVLAVTRLLAVVFALSTAVDCFFRTLTSGLLPPLILPLLLADFTARPLAVVAVGSFFLVERPEADGGEEEGVRLRSSSACWRSQAHSSSRCFSSS